MIVRGEGEETLVELDKKAGKPSDLRHEEKIFHNPLIELIEDLEQIPYPGYHLVWDLMGKYHFAAMAGHKAPYALIEGSRGCSHACAFCTQWKHWHRQWRGKSPKRIADEIEYYYNNFGSRFIWLTDDNLGSAERIGEIADEFLPKLRRSGLR